MPENPDASVSFAKAAALSPVSGYLYFRKTTESGVSEVHSIETLRAAIGGSDLTVNTVGVVFNGAVAITSPADADLLPVTQASVVKKITWANIKGTLKTYFDSLYATKAQGTKADNALPTTSYTAADVLTKIKTVDGAGSGLDADSLQGAEPDAAATANTIAKRDANGHIYAAYIHSNAVADNSAATNYLYDIGDGYFRRKSLANARTELVTATDVLTKIKTVDGTGSGLDSDLLQGYSISTLLSAIYPIGSIYLSVSPTNPSSLFGGTWARIAAGRTLFGINESDTRFDAAEDYGGEYEHLHSVPVHTHGGAGLFANINLSANSRVYAAKAAYAWTGNPSSFVQGSANTQTVNGDVNTQGVIVGGSTANNAASNTGNGSSLPPYLAVYIWKRTA